MFYAFIKMLAWPMRVLYFRMSREGLENFPRQGPVIVVANHTSYLDAGVLGSGLPRKVHFVVLERMFRLWRFRWFYLGMQTIPVDPGAGQRGPIRKCLEMLERDEVVGIFPEGSRSTDGQLSQGQEGAALIAKRSGAPVVPVGILGAHDALPRGAVFPRPRKIRMRIGKPLRYAQGDAQMQRDALRLFTSQIMRSIGELSSELPDEPMQAAEKLR